MDFGAESQNPRIAIFGADSIAESQIFGAESTAKIANRHS